MDRERDRQRHTEKERESAGSDSMTSFRLRTVINQVNMLQPSNHQQKIEAFHHKKNLREMERELQRGKQSTKQQKDTLVQCNRQKRLRYERGTKVKTQAGL